MMIMNIFVEMIKLINQSLIIPQSLIIDPYNDPLGFCGVIDSAVQAHYQGLLSNYFLWFLIGGLLAGLMIGLAWYFHRIAYLHKKGRVLPKNK